MFPKGFTVLLLALICLTATLSAADQPAQDWPGWRGPTHDGKSTLTGIRKTWPNGLKKLWESTEIVQGDLSPNNGNSSPVVKDNIVVVHGRADDKDLILAFDATKGGKPLWTQSYDSPNDKLSKNEGIGARATPCIDGGRVFTFSSWGHIGCWDLKTGNPLWLKKVSEDAPKLKTPYWGFCSSPAAFEKNVLLILGGYSQGGKAPLVIAYDQATGKPSWQAADGIGSWAALKVVTLDNKMQALAFGADGLHGLDPASGREYWKIPWKTAYDCNATTPVVDGSTLFVTSGYKAGCQAFDIKDDKVTPLWDKSKALASCNSDPVLHDGYVYSFSGNGMSGELKCLELKTGAVKWETKELGNGSLVLVDGCLLCLSYKGILALVEAKPDGYRKLAEMTAFAKVDAKQPAYPSPAIANGKLYLRYRETLTCYDLLH